MQTGDEYAVERERLRTALLALRENAALAAQTIGRQLPELTVHDVTHADALWGVAGEIAGPQTRLNPVEAFVLGAAFYTHDLGLGLASFPQGPEQLRSSAEVNDALAAQLLRTLERWPTAAELDAADQSARQAALFEVLRAQHAERAERLLTQSLPHPDGGGLLYLLDNQDLRDRYAAVIGRIAHSHGWQVDELRGAFTEARGGPGWAPHWDLDRLRIACLLRLADASHLDERRAPPLLQTLNRVAAEESRRHWVFQRRLLPARRNGDRLEFTSAEGFPPAEASAWWLCYETLRMVDAELRQVDAMLSDLNRPRFAARGVAGIDSPARLQAFVEADGWEPVDAQVHVPDVARLVRQLGGEELYGRDLSVPLRELIQNGADAVSARRVLEQRDGSYGAVTVRAGEGDDECGPWIEVQDDGLGMSVEVMRRFLLSFGASYWSSSALSREFPELTRRRFASTGRYGIGFFSVFMWGDHVKVVSRRCDMAQADTRVLEFASGLDQRPIIRPASAAERLRDGGTLVRVWLEQEKLCNVLGHDPLGWRFRDTGLTTVGIKELGDLCRRLAPALEVSLDVETADGSARVITGGDWKSVPASELYDRIEKWSTPEDPSLHLEPEVIYDDHGEAVGRATLTGAARSAYVVGGLRANGPTGGLRGIFLASPVRAARDSAVPLVSDAELARWATQEADRATTANLQIAAQLELASTVLHYGGSIGALPVALCARGSLTSDDLVDWLSSREAVRLIGGRKLLEYFFAEELMLADDVLIVEMTSYERLRADAPDAEEFQATVGPEAAGPNRPLAVVIEAAMEAWSASIDQLVLVDDLTSEFEPIGERSGGGGMFTHNHLMTRAVSRQAVTNRLLDAAFHGIFAYKRRGAADLASELGISTDALATLLAPFIEVGRITKLKSSYKAELDRDFEFDEVG